MFYFYMMFWMDVVELLPGVYAEEHKACNLLNVYTNVTYV